MSVMQERAIAGQKAFFDTVLAAQNAAFSGFEKLVDLHVKVARATLDEASLKAKEAFELKDGQDALAFSTSLGQPSAEKALAYGRHVYDIVSGMQAEFARLSEARMAEHQAQFAEAVEQMSKNAPAGSETAMALLKSSMATATSAYDSVSRATRQAAEMAESNMKSATNATLKAASEAAARTAQARNAAVAATTGN